jgi:hypothetical protein
MDKQDEMRAQQILNQLKSQQGGMGQPQQPQQNPNQYVPDPNAVDNQGNAAGVETMEIPGIGTVYKDAGLSADNNKDKAPAPPTPQQNYSAPAGVGASPTGSSACPQCGKFHPPLKSGEQCPMAPVRIKTADGTEKIIDVNLFLDKLKVIFLSQLEQKSVVDPDDFMKYLIVEVTKAIEKYEGKKST